MPAAQNEETPLNAAGETGGSTSTFNAHSMKTFGMAISTITFSVGLINYNKYLMTEGRFPYAVPLTLIQQACCTLFAGVLYVCWPSLFPALTDPLKKVPMDSSFFVKAIMPIGLLFASSLVLTNCAYEELSVAFLQMMKESNIVLVYLLSLLAALEVFSWRHVQIIVFAIFAASLTIKGEMNFSLAGFLMQFTGGFCECARIVMQGVVLSGKKLDALTYVLVVSPVSFCFLGVVLVFLVFVPAGDAIPGLALPTWGQVWDYSTLIFGNAIIAFGLNVNIALLIKNTSPTSYIFVGVAKDIVAILVSVIFLHELVSGLQYFSFALQIGSVLTWSLLKLHPDKFEHGIFSGLFTLFCEWTSLQAPEKSRAMDNLKGGALQKPYTLDNKADKVV